LPRKFTLPLIAVIFLICAGSGVKADPILITFDPVPTAFAPGQYSHLSYAAQGVVLVSGEVSSNPNGPLSAYSAFGIGGPGHPITPLSIAFGWVGRNPPPIFFRNLQGNFVLPGPSPGMLSPSETDFVAFDVVATQQGQGDAWTASIYDRDNHLLSSVSGTTDGPVVFSRTVRDIHRFTLIVSSRWEGIDNLSFNAPQVPEPATLLLFGTGMAGLSAVIRRRRKAQ
jgi:hypothetical protein